MSDVFDTYLLTFFFFFSLSFSSPIRGCERLCGEMPMQK